MNNHFEIVGRVQFKEIDGFEYVTMGIVHLSVGDST